MENCCLPHLYQRGPQQQRNTEKSLGDRVPHTHRKPRSGKVQHTASTEQPKQSALNTRAPNNEQTKSEPQETSKRAQTKHQRPLNYSSLASRYFLLDAFSIAVLVPPSFLTDAPLFPAVVVKISHSFLAHRHLNGKLLSAPFVPSGEFLKWEGCEWRSHGFIASGISSDTCNASGDLKLA